MTKSIEWKLFKGTWISPNPVLPGVWQRKEGGHAVRGRVTDPRTGKLKDVWKVLPDLDQTAAHKWLQEELDRVRHGVVVTTSPKVPFATYAVSLLKRKVSEGDMKSQSGIEKWGYVLSRLIESRLGQLYVDQIRTADILAWKSDMAVKINAGDYKATTINTWLAVLKVVLKHAKLDFGLSHNPATDVTAFDTSRHRTYTFEEPNSLTVEELRDFLAIMREKYPQHFAMTFAGFATGLRPSSLRPLRRKGPTPDVVWDRNLLLIRQSQTRGDFVMVGTKTAVDQTITVPKDLMDVLRWHVETQLQPGPQRESDLLFPAETGGFRSSSALDKPFKDVARAMNLKKTITPRGMRRSFQDLARAAEVQDIVTRSISGHATETMQRHYSTVSPREQERGLAKVLQLMDYRAKDKGRAGNSPPAGASPGGEDCGEGASEVLILPTQGRS